MSINGEKQGSAPAAVTYYWSSTINDHLLIMENVMDFIDNEGRYRYSLTPLPGNHDVIVSHGAWVNPSLRGNGLGQQLHHERIKYAKDSGHSYMLATVNADNKAQVHIMRKNGWKELDSFVSECTCHRVILFGRKSTD